uniref:Uncharacterized protein n=1 Tax=Zea mays TaxID=4577 RepID=C4IZQ6_MAIZE|nr:unknown [Zea mays]
MQSRGSRDRMEEPQPACRSFSLPTTARSAANPLHAFPAEKERDTRHIILLLYYTATATAHPPPPPVQVRIWNLHARVVVVVVAQHPELLRPGGGSVVAYSNDDDRRRRRRRLVGAAGAEGRLGRAPRQVRGHQRLRLRLRPQRALVAPAAAPRGHAACAVPGRRPAPTTAAAPEAEEGAYRSLSRSLSLSRRAMRCFCSPWAVPLLVLALCLQVLCCCWRWW